MPEEGAAAAETTAATTGKRRRSGVAEPFATATATAGRAESIPFSSAKDASIPALDWHDWVESDARPARETWVTIVDKCGSSY